MANRIKGITVEIGGDATKLDKALQGVNKEIRNTQAQLKDVEKLLKLDPTNTELLRQKQKLLSDAVSETNDKLKTLKEAEKQLSDSGVDKNSAQYMALQREIIATEESLEKLTKQANESNASLAKIGIVSKKVSESADAFAQKTKGVSVAAAGAIAAIGGVAVKSAVAADDLNTLAKQTGLTTETLQKAQYAADLIDVSYETFTGSVAKMTAKLRTSEQDFEALNIATRDANGEFLSTEEIYFNAANAISAIGNETERDIAAQEIFGKSAAELAGILDDGGAAFKKYGEQAEEAGLILSQDTLDSLNEVNDQLDTLKADALGTFAKAGAAALQALQPVLEKITAAIGKVLEAVGKLSPKQAGILTAVLAVIAAISPIAKIIAKITAAVSKLMPILSTIFAVIAANPVVLIIAGIAAAVTALTVLIVKNWDKIKAFMAKAVEAVKGFVNKVGVKMAEITLKIITPFIIAKEKIKDIVDKIKDLFANFKIKLPDIKLPHLKISGGKAPWGIGGKGSLPKFSVDWYAKAMNRPMILNNPTIFGAMNGHLLGGGEAGAEVVAGQSVLMKMIRSAVNDDSGNSAILSELRTLNNNLSNMGIYLDGDTLVGGITERMDSSLGASASAMHRRALA